MKTVMIYVRWYRAVAFALLETCSEYIQN